MSEQVTLRAVYERGWTTPDRVALYAGPQFVMNLPPSRTPDYHMDDDECAALTLADVLRDLIGAHLESRDDD